MFKWYGLARKNTKKVLNLRKKCNLILHKDYLVHFKYEVNNYTSKLIGNITLLRYLEWTLKPPLFPCSLSFLP